MDKPFTILLADRNRRVREFLQRELAAEGYCVQTAGDGREILMMLEGDPSPDLLVLDLEMPFLSGAEILEWLRDRRAATPVVIHSFMTDGTNQAAIDGIAAFVEKSGDNIHRLKETILAVLRRHYPARFGILEDAGIREPARV